MKTRFNVKLMSVALLSVWLTSGCADQSTKTEAASKASPEATAAIANANDAIAIAKSNDWIWRDTESFLSKAQAAADAFVRVDYEPGAAVQLLHRLDPRPFEGLKRPQPFDGRPTQKLPQLPRAPRPRPAHPAPARHLRPR